jgi:hypothetical protein
MASLRLAEYDWSKQNSINHKIAKQKDLSVMDYLVWYIENLVAIDWSLI